MVARSVPITIYIKYKKPTGGSKTAKRKPTKKTTIKKKTAKKTVGKRGRPRKK